MKSQSNRSFLKRLNENFYNFWFVLLGVVVITISPALIFYNKIELDKNLFVTEWLKTCSEVFLIILLLKTLGIWRDYRQEKTSAQEFIDDNLILFIDEALESLQELNKNLTQENREKIGPGLKLCCGEVEAFFQRKLYLQLKDKSRAMKLFYLHDQFINEGYLSHLNNYSESFSSLSTEKIGLLKNILNKISYYTRT